MQRTCEHCGEAFEAQRSTARFCGSDCRARKAKGESPSPTSEAARDFLNADLVVTVVAELNEAGVLDTVMGQLAVTLAKRVALPGTSDGSVGGLAKELRTTMDAALASAAPAASPMDMLRARRDAKRGA